MGQCMSLVEDARVQQLQQQNAALQQQLSHYQKQAGGYAAAVQHGAAYPVVPAPAANPAAGMAEVLWFPDPAMPCKYGAQCRRGPSCTYAHGPTSLARLLQLLASAQRTLDICVFTITCNELAEVVVAAHRRGVRVRVITDNDQALSNGSDVAELRAAGISVHTDKDQYHMHHKFAVVDGRLLLNGSFNWTRQAVLNNQENVVVANNMLLISTFQKHFEAMWAKFA